MIPDPVIAQATNADILWQVYKIESSRGKNDGCRSKGLFNGFGYAQPDDAMAAGNGKCYPSFEAVIADVDKWFTKQLQTKTLAQALCYYNEGAPKGVVRSNCHYYEVKYLTW